MIEREFHEYQEKVFNYLEYIGYPQYVSDFEPEGIAKSIFRVSVTFFICGQSHRMAAISIFGMSWEKIKKNQNIHRSPRVH